LICLREPSLGPCFGMKGGAAGGGYAQVVPMEDINLHFTGDFHAIGAAHNLLSALIDNHMHWENQLNIDPRRVTWRRVLDMNERALRTITSGLGGFHNGVVREAGFDITVASEVMAILCLADGPEDLRARLSRILVGLTREGDPIVAGDLDVVGSMMVLLKDALLPNLVQSGAGVPALVHGGPGGQVRNEFHPLIQYLVNHGYAVYAINNRGSSGYGKDFFMADDRKHGQADLDDCVASKGMLIETGWVDPDRIGIIGGSYGGYMVLAAQTFRPEEFAAGVDLFGISNWVRTMESIPPWWESFRKALEQEMGPVDDPEFFRAKSPLFHAENIRRPLSTCGWGAGTPVRPRASVKKTKGSRCQRRWSFLSPRETVHGSRAIPPQGPVTTGVRCPSSPTFARVMTQTRFFSDRFRGPWWEARPIASASTAESSRSAYASLIDSINR